MHEDTEEHKALCSWILPPAEPWLVNGRFVGLKTALEISLGIGLLLREVLEAQTCCEDVDDSPEDHGYPAHYSNTRLSFTWIDKLLEQCARMQAAIEQYWQVKLAKQHSQKLQDMAPIAGPSEINCFGQAADVLPGSSDMANAPERGQEGMMRRMEAKSTTYLH